MCCWTLTDATGSLPTMGGDRPELQAPPEIYYDAKEAEKYTSNRRIIEVQSGLTERALELLRLPQEGGPRYLLDVGCGSGLSGEILEEHGHVWVGVDISEAMLSVAIEREVEGDLCLWDFGRGIPFRDGIFDGAVSISAVQWLCNADRSDVNPIRRMQTFFRGLYRCLAKDARAVLQIYPKDDEQSSMLVKAATEAGFTGGLVVDYPNSTRARKSFLVLMVGTAFPQEMDELSEKTHIDVARRRTRKYQATKKRRNWVLAKKERMRVKGREGIPTDTKFTGRRRRPRF